MTACINAASAMVSSTSMGISHILNSMVLKKGWRRTSYQIFLPLSMHFVLTSRFIYLSYSSALEKKSGIPVRGNLSNTFTRYDLNPVLRPCQNGELVDNAKM